MRLVDANILVYAFTTSFPQHERARPISRETIWSMVTPTCTSVVVCLTLSPASTFIFG